MDECPGILAGVRQLLAGGETLSVRHARAALAALPGTRLLNAYGPTEATTFTTCHPIPRNLPPHLISIPLGRPIQRTVVRVLDPARRLLPAGAFGELCVGGPGLARGYLNLPELTAERFIPDPHDTDSEARLYLTGDRVRWTFDGVLEFAGRFDEQLKIRGFRIEPGEIETVLRRHPAVGDVAVVGREIVPGDGLQLVAYVVPKVHGSVPDPRELLDFLARSLPGHLCPRIFRTLTALPLSPHGKIDRSRLPLHVDTDSPGIIESPAPASSAGTIARIFGDLLGRDPFGTAEDFFGAGGHSLLAMRAVARIRERLGIEVSVAQIFEHPTAAQLAGHGTSGLVDGLPLRPERVRVPRDAWHPLLHGQLSIWEMVARFPDRPSVNNHRGLRLLGRLDAGALRAALEAIVDRHEALRTRVIMVDGKPAQRVALSRRFELPTADLGTLSPTEALARIQREADADAHHPFDLAEGTLFRARLLRLGREDHALLLGVHHIAFDGWSLGILNQELGEAYQALREGRDWSPPPLRVQPVDCATWEHACASSADHRRQVDYWRGKLAGIRNLPDLPRTETPVPPGDFRAQCTELTLTEPLTAALRGCARRERCTLSTVMLAALKTLIHQACDLEDVVVGAPMAARTQSGIEGVIGCFRKRVLLRTDLAGNPSFREILNRVQQTSIEAMTHQDVSLAEVFPGYTTEHRLHWASVPFAFNYREGIDLPPNLPEIDVRPFSRTRHFSTLPLNVHILAEQNAIRLRLFSRLEQYPPGTIDGFLSDYQGLLECVIRNPDARVPPFASRSLGRPGPAD